MPDKFLKQFHILSKTRDEHRDCGSYQECIHKVLSARPAIAVLGMRVSLAAKGTLGLRKAFRSFGLSKEQIINFPSIRSCRGKGTYFSLQPEKYAKEPPLRLILLKAEGRLGF